MKENKRLVEEIRKETEKVFSPHREMETKYEVETTRIVKLNSGPIMIFGPDGRPQFYRN